MKRFGCVALCLILLICLAGCGGKTYTDDKTAAQVAEAALSAIGSPADYTDGTADSYEFYFGESAAAEKVNDRCMMFHRETTNVDQIGVLHLTEGKHASAVENEVEKYLDSQVEYLRSFAQNYSPEDLSKIDNAGYRTLGNYVVYYILDQDDEAAAMTAVENLLTVQP